MEEDIRKQGMLYLQQQRFGKKWKRVWCVLYRESSCSISRLEFFECKDGGTLEKSDKNLRKQQEHKKVIRLADCIRVTEVEMDGCPRDTGPFLVETTEKIYVFAVERQQLDDWTHKLCEIAFPMSWAEHSVKRGSLHRGKRVDEDEGMEDNSLYSGRQTVRDFRVCVRRTEASDRCRLKGDGVLRAGAEALQLLDKSGDVLFTWPYRFLRRFGRDKSTFSFEAGRRCDSGEGSFEFDTKQGNILFQAVEAAINVQRISIPQRQASGGGQVSPESPQSLNMPPLPSNPPLVQSRTPPPPLLRSYIPQSPAAQAADCVYSMVTETPHLQMIHHKDKESAASSQQQQQQRPQLSRLEPPLDKTLTGVKSLTLETRGVPRKSQVKMISSCPLPHAGPELGPTPAPGPGSNNLHSHPHLSPNLSSSLEQAYSQISLPAERSTKREKRGGGGGGGGGGSGGGSGGGGGGGGMAPVMAPEPEYSLPFDTIAKNVMVNIRNSGQAHSADLGADPLYDSIDEMKIRNIFPSRAAAHAPTYGKLEHIYDEPEGCAATAAIAAIPATSATATNAPAATAAAAAAAPKQTPAAPTSLYDDPEEMRGDAWRIMGTAADPKGHEYPYNPRVDDYAVPKQVQRAFPAAQCTSEEEDSGEEPQEEEQQQHADSPYNNVMVKMA